MRALIGASVSEVSIAVVWGKRLFRSGMDVSAVDRLGGSVALSASVADLIGSLRSSISLRGSILLLLVVFTLVSTLISLWGVPTLTLGLGLSLSGENGCSDN
jgi:hypothetical protein